MKIVASNSLTLSNVNDGTITHTAWSWSADGKDGFTTTYPNLNLLTNTTFKNYTPVTQQYLSMAIKDGGVNNKPYVSMSYNNPTINTFIDKISWGFDKEYFKPSTTYTFSFYLRGNGTLRTHVYPTLIDASSANGLADGKVITPNVDGSYDWNLTSEWVRHTYTFITKSSITDKQNFLFRVFTGNSVDICLPKVEEGSVATPWMPSSSEVKTSDYPSYIGTYSDDNVESSLDYSKYQWAIFKGQNSNAYIAYSWSSDGTNRFTTIYPNLNLLKGTKDSTSITGNNTANQVGLLFPFDNDKTLANQGFNINDILTLEFDWSATNPASGYFILQWQGVPWGFSLPTINISSTNSSGHVVYTFNVRDKDIASTAYATGIGYRLDNIPTNTVITFSNVIIRKANGSQPWTPSESEAQDQWQDAIPMYVGVGEKDSQNPTDYRWQLNPRYVQASSDNGLSNKAGLDDLASVADTANDALVQAQNAVSNEDYTSWLEHGYQNTIKNLQDVSTQNQKDIKSVNNRTTVVEGFYGEMKVKWNFIDESFSFSEEGMFISNAQSKMSIQITSDKIVFWDNNVDVAFITGEVLNIQKGVFLESATIGNHLITKFSDSSPVTIIRYVGGNT